MERAYFANSSGSAPPPPPGYPSTQQNILPSSWDQRDMNLHEQCYSATSPQQRQLSSVVDSGICSPDLFASQHRLMHLHQSSTPAPPSSDVVLNFPMYSEQCFVGAGRADSNVAANSASDVYHSAGQPTPQHGFSTSQPFRLPHAHPSCNQMYLPRSGNIMQEERLMYVGDSPLLPASHAMHPPQQVVPSPVAPPAPGSSSAVPHASFSAPTTQPAATDTVDLMKAVAHWPKLPEFKPRNPDLWFTLVEGIFAHCRMDDNSKFLCLMTALCNHENLIIDLVGMPASPDRYERAKATILTRLGRSVSESVRKILHGVNMGKHTPSELWRYLRAIARPSVISDEALRTIWQDKLPAHVGLTLSNSPYAPLEQTLESADRIFASYKRYGGLRGLMSFDPGALYKVEQPGSHNNNNNNSRGRGRGRGRGRQPLVIEAPPPLPHPARKT